LLCLKLGQCFTQTFSEQQYKDFASPTPEELQLRTCSFDPEAAAVFLRKDATITPDGYKMYSFHRNRIKILKKTGLDAANIKIRFYHAGEFEKVDNITAVTINYAPDGTKKMSMLERRNIFVTKDDQFYSTITFTMPDVQEGSMIEYSYISERRSYKVVDYWYFQDEIPVLYSQFDYTIMPGAQFSYRVLKPSGLPISLKEIKQEGRLVFEMKNLPAITNEPYMDAKRDYLSRVELQMNYMGTGIDRQRFVSSWPELTQELLKDEEFGIALNRKIPGTENIVKQAMTITDLQLRTRFIFYQVMQQLSWNHYIGIYASDKLKNVWEKKLGSAAEINLTLINLLNEAGISAAPLLVSDRGHGKINTSHPFVSQFSKVIAYVKLDNNTYFLDATESNNNINLIPQNFLNTTGYLVDRKNSAFIEIRDPVHFEKRLINISGKISNNGVLTGQAYVSDRDYSRIVKETAIRADKEEFIQNSFVSPYNSMNVDSFRIDNLESDSLPLNQIVSFNHQLENSGDYLLLYPNMFGSVEKNPFLSENRYTEINFGYKRALSFNESFNLPDGLVVEALPKSMALRTPDTGMVVTRITDMQTGTNNIVVKIKLELNRTVYSPEEYPGVREFFKKMYALLNEPIVLKRKP
jgi:hypothetical protein